MMPYLFRVYWFLCVLTLIGEARAAPPVAQVERDPGCAAVVPCIEINSPSDEAIRHLIRGMQPWRLVSDTAIVSTNKYGVDGLYGDPRVQGCGMKIIPGVKGLHDLGSASRHVCLIDQPGAWRDYATSVARAMELTGSHLVFLELEGVQGHIVDGTAHPYLPAVAELVKILPTETPAGERVVYIWYPTVTSYRPARRLRQADLVATASAGLAGHIAYAENGTLWSPDDLDAPFRAYLGEMLDYLETRYARPGTPRYRMVYTYGGVKFWPPERVPEALDRIDADDVAVIYTGYDAWVDDSREVVKALVEAGVFARTVASGASNER